MVQLLDGALEVLKVWNHLPRSLAPDHSLQVGHDLSVWKWFNDGRSFNTRVVYLPGAIVRYLCHPSCADTVSSINQH